jgi:hypothetical protein
MKVAMEYPSTYLPIYMPKHNNSTRSIGLIYWLVIGFQLIGLYLMSGNPSKSNEIY